MISLRSVARAISRLALAPAALIPTLVALTAHPAFAQTFEKIEGKTTEDVPAVPFVGLAYGIIWLAVVAYVVSLARKISRTKEELEELKRKVDRATGAP